MSTLANSYLDATGLKARIAAPSSLVDGTFIPADKTVDRAAWTSFVNSRLQIESSRIDAILKKRYAVPFKDPVPEIVLGWLADRVRPLLYERRGWDMSDEQAQSIKDAAEAALVQMKEAADSDVGLYDLPLANDQSGTSGVVNGGPYSYAEASPYSWTDVQADTINGGGV